MARNPKGGWWLSQVMKACSEHGASCEPPRGGGSHYKVSKPGKREVLTIPFKRLCTPHSASLHAGYNQHMVN